jgi:hypothetical protein
MIVGLLRRLSVLGGRGGLGCARRWRLANASKGRVYFILCKILGSKESDALFKWCRCDGRVLED